MCDPCIFKNVFISQISLIRDFAFLEPKEFHQRTIIKDNYLDFSTLKQSQTGSCRIIMKALKNIKTVFNFWFILYYNH